VLTSWRRRIATSKTPGLLGELVAEVVRATGVLAGKRQRVVDSTVLADAVATQDTMTQLVAQIRRVRRLIPALREVPLAPEIDYARAKPAIDYRDDEAVVRTLERPRRRCEGPPGCSGAARGEHPHRDPV